MPSIDLRTICGQDTELKRVSSSEVAGPCPKCSGDDRFHCTAEWWFCRKCHPERGDAIDYVRWRDGIGYLEACEQLGIAPRDRSEKRHVASTIPSAEATPAPSAAWQQRGRQAIEYGCAQLAVSPSAQNYLLDRGLTRETIAAARIGFFPEEMHDAGSRWGLDEDVWLPRGWVIPGTMGGQLHYLKVRRPDAKPRYIAVRGSVKRGVLYGLDEMPRGDDLIVCEGEFNALVLAQCLGPVAGVASVGDCGNHPGPEAISTMLRFRRWWLLMDPDTAGRHGSEKLTERYARFQELRWPYSVDINDAYTDGHCLAMRLVPQIGPPIVNGNSSERVAWLSRWLSEDSPLAHLDGQERDSPDLRLWYALYGAYRKVGYSEGIEESDA